MNKIIYQEINGERIALKKGIFGWGIVYPLRDEDGKINWKNCIAGGSWVKLIFLAVLVFFIIMAIVEYTTNFQFCAEVINNQTKVILPQLKLP